jgi:energy-coupling factor transporter ATP-binding protein EcfA2
MQLSGRPLLDNDADNALFVGRDVALRKIDRSLRSGLNCLVVGAPGSGKTSLVRALMFRSHEAVDPLLVTYVRANESRSAVDLLATILPAVRPGPVERRAPLDMLDELAGHVSAGSTAQPGSRVFVVDDVAAAAGSELFGALRDEVWQVGAQWLVTTSTAQAPALLRPPADVFFETVVEMGALTVEEATELLRRRLVAPAGAARDAPTAAGSDTAFGTAIDTEIELAIDTAIDTARETPRRLLDVVRELTADTAVGGLRLTTGTGLRARSAALEQVSRPARMLAQELEALGWAGASDERLLERMGWTRPRVVQVMSELVNRGLVQMREENTGRGRPRKLYRLTPAAEFTDPSEAVTPR